MKMMIAILKDADADQVIQSLTAAEVRVTRVASTGGFLRSGVVTLLIGLEDEHVETAIQVIRAQVSKPDAQESRATLFVVPVQRFEQI